MVTHYLDSHWLIEAIKPGIKGHDLRRLTITNPTVPNTNIHSQLIHMATTLAKRLEKAATDFPGAVTLAWVQYHAEGGTVSVRMIAPEVIKEFRGSIKSGTGGKDKFVTGRLNCSPV
jgi:hypothetical protein